MGTVVEVKKDLAKKLPKKFSVAFDGWLEHGVHYLPVIAVGDFFPMKGVYYLDSHHLNRRMTYHLTNMYHTLNILGIITNGVSTM